MTEQEQLYLTLLGARIRTERQARKLGLDSLADQAGLHRTHLWKIEKGQLNAGLLSYARIAESLGTGLGTLLPGIALQEPAPEANR